ncbi:hypothetical protein [Burkholderia sp. L27(2015)]|uniref:hypothetical protein n=1 Tax=Burkholderia sp. L27(2015) TaxID=1641858 RepID=UPI00131A658C|nr:hypothetical protein [Burkholderia sp. L27(2015)]
MQTIFKSVALTSALLFAGTSNSKAADICNESGFDTVPAGQIRIGNELKGKSVEFRTTASELSRGYGPEATSTQSVIAEQAARDAIFRAFARVVRPPTAAASLEISGLQSVAAICDGENVFDFRVPMSGLHWRTAPAETGPELLPPIRRFLRDNGVID